LVSPAEFIPQAEESGLIIPIGLWMLVNVCMQLKTWEANPMTQSLTLSVNVSARQFSQPDFVEQVCKVLERTGAKATRLKIELTESLVLDDVADTIEKMKALKLLGVNFSIDDFGTGYSSLSYLKKLPINQLKIDQNFVREIDTDHSDAIIVQTIIGMAHNFGFNVIAEGVETKAQRDCLVRYGCNAFQGYLFSKPVPLEDFEKLISEIIKPDLSAN
jgi:EAL domain-containing protein (putative c-di-GMP-specific phosphodiesterase class I)